MDGILRRRELILTGTSPSDVLYNLENMTMERGGGINTGVQLFDTNKDFSIVMDVTTLEAPVNTSGAVCSQARFFYLLFADGSNWPGIIWYKSGASSLQSAFKYGYKQIQNTGTIGKNIRNRCVCTHAGGTLTTTAKLRRATDSVITATCTNTADMPSSETALWVGTPSSATTWRNLRMQIHRFTVYNRVLTADEINAFLA